MQENSQIFVAGVISIDETIYKSHTPGTQGEGMGIPFAAPQYTYSSKGLTVTGEQGDIQTGALTVGKTAEERNTIRWPHVVFTERGAETGAPCTPTISQDGQLLAAGYEDTFIRLFDLTKECLVSLFSGHDEAVRCAKFSPDNKLLATGSVDTTIIVWNVEDGRQVKRLQGHDADVWTLAISPDGEDIVSGSADTAVKFWKLKGESETEFAQVSGHPATVEAVTYTPDSSRVLACSGEVGYIYSRAGKAFATMTGHQGIIYSLETSHRGDRVITGSEDHTARIWLIETGVELVTIRQHHEPVWSAHFSMDDTTVLCGSYDTTVSIHDSYTGELHFILQSNTSFVESVAYFPRGDLVASGAADGLVMLWEASTGEKVAELKCHVDKVTSIQFSPGGENLVTSSEDGTIRLLNVVDVLRVC